MNLEKQVTNPELSKKLEKLGVKQDSLYMWVKYELWKKPRIWDSDIEKEFKHTCLSGKREYAYPAYTVAEMLTLMPGRNKRWEIEGKWSNDWWLKIEQSWCGRKTDGSMKNCWGVNYYSDVDEYKLIDEIVFNENLADELAIMLIYLKENNLL